MEVKLINHTPEPDKTVAAAARLCYSPIGASEMMEDMTPEKVQQFVSMLVKMGHHSPTEHVTFTFAIEGVSRALSHQLVRHRIASYSQQSQRYVREENFDYVIPLTIEGDAEAKKLFIETMDYLQEVYGKLAQKVHQEDARYVLPNACETKLVATFNTRSLLNFFQHRTCQRAQWEIRKLAQQMLSEVRKVAPILFAKAGPTCMTDGFCREGAMSCGLLDKLNAAKETAENIIGDDTRHESKNAKIFEDKD